MTTLVSRETARMQVQRQLDAAKSLSERNSLGQFATPPQLAASIVRCAVASLPEREAIRFLDPAFGTGSFYSALMDSVGETRLASCRGVELDWDVIRAARRLWRGTHLRLRAADFTDLPPPKSEQVKANLIVCNPPYVRHHHLLRLEKIRLQAAADNSAGIKLSGLSGLYCYFLAIAHGWLARDGVAAWLIPSEFMDVNYGRAVREYLLDRVTLLRIHRFHPDDVQFGDALVSSAVVCFRNSAPRDDHCVAFTFGGSLERPEQRLAVDVAELRAQQKWPSAARSVVRPPRPAALLADLFTIKRGLATGCNEFFVLSAERIAQLKIPQTFLRPILPSPRFLATDEILSDENGAPRIDRQRWLLDCRLSPEEVAERCPELSNYFQSGRQRGVHERYLCRHRRPWYTQENRLPAPFLCTYMSRENENGKSFRFILNHSRASAANVYLLLYPKLPLAELLAERPTVKRHVWQALSAITSASLTQQGRVYGGGLHKLEPKELANVPAEGVMSVLPKSFSL